MKELLVIKNLKKYFLIENMFSGKKDIVKAVDDVTFCVEKEKIVALVGESGSGKTTVARCIAGLEIKDTGEILYEGKEISFDTKEKRRKIQYIFQDSMGSLNPRMRVKDVIEEPLKFHFDLKGEELKNKVNEYLYSVGLNENFKEKFPHELSGGQRQRIVIARALTMQPSLLIADEPVSNLDVSIQAQILKLFLDLNKKEKLTILFITHDLRIVKNLADYVIVMKNGKIVEMGEVGRVFSKPKSEYTKVLLSSIPGMDR
jgi:ABC-type oligopeptide transport system ATPase subunit